MNAQLLAALNYGLKVNWIPPLKDFMPASIERFTAWNRHSKTMCIGRYADILTADTVAEVSQWRDDMNAETPGKYDAVLLVPPTINRATVAELIDEREDGLLIYRIDVKGAGCPMLSRVFGNDQLPTFRPDEKPPKDYWRGLAAS